MLFIVMLPLFISDTCAIFGPIRDKNRIVLIAQHKSFMVNSLVIGRDGQRGVAWVTMSIFLQVLAQFGVQKIRESNACRGPEAQASPKQNTGGPELA